MNLRPGVLWYGEGRNPDIHHSLPTGIVLPQKMPPSITVADNYGEIQTNHHLIKREFVGKW